MEGLAPPHECVLELHSSLTNGESVRVAVLRYIHAHPGDFAVTLRKFLLAWEQGQDWRSVVQGQSSAHRRILCEMIASGLTGQPIQTQLRELQGEIELSSELEIKHQLDMLPLQMLIPLLLFQFPAFLALLFGPLLTQLLRELN